MWARAILLIGLVGVSYGANILVMLPLPLFSHTNAFMPIIEGLAHRGHNITFVSGVPLKKPVKNINYIPVNVSMESFLDVGKLAESSGFGRFLFSFALFILPAKLIGKACQTEGVQRMVMDKDSKFDLILTETFFIQELFVTFGHKYNAPVVNFHATELSTFACECTGNPNPFSYVPRKMMGMTDHMSYLERVLNTFGNLLEIAIIHLYYIPLQESFIRDHFKYEGSENIPPLLEMLKNTSLNLIDSHYAMGYPRPYHRNVIEIGGLTIKEVKPLPPDLQDLMDKATDGVIYFTIGSHLKSSELNPAVIKSMVSAFGKIKQTVLWKWEDAPMPNKPDNVVLGSWFPQNSVLTHPNCKLFITHGGFHSLFESMYFGVPIVGIPVFADQPHNLRAVLSKGVGAMLSFKDLTEEQLLNSINTVINTPSYKENTMKLSAILRDMPISTLDNALYWIEHVIKHGGARHLRPASLDISWYQYILLDVVPLLIGILIINIFITFAICKRCCCRKSVTKSSKQD